jgi:1,2-diacylglycerol 3-alpha-glucosyltransferase
VAATRLVDRLREHHDVTVVGAEVDGPDCVKLPGFQFPIRAMREQHFVMARPQRAKLVRLFADVDVVHLQFPFWLSWVALDEARRAGLPVVAAFHVQPENALLNVGIRSAWLSRVAYRFWVDHLYNRADAVICPSDFAAAKLRSFGLQSPAFVVSNGVHRSGPRPTRLPDPRVDRPFVVMMLGRLAAEKRQDLLIEAVKRSRYRDRIRLVISGMGPQESALRKQAASLPGGAQIGFLPKEQLDSVLSSADLFVHCSEVELEGMAVLEAMSAGLPVLIANGPESAAAQFALDDRFLFPSGNAQALAAKLDALLDQPHLLRYAGLASQRAANALDVDESAQKVANLYHHVVGLQQRRLPLASSASNDQSLPQQKAG